MKRLHRITAIALTGLVGLSTLSAPLAARASEEGKRNTAIGVGAAALGLLLTQKNKLPGLIAAGGAAYAYSEYDKGVRARHRQEQDGYYYDRRDQRHDDTYRYHQNSDDNGYNRDNGYRYHRNDNQDYRDNGSQNYHDNNRNDRRSSLRRDR